MQLQNYINIIGGRYHENQWKKCWKSDSLKYFIFPLLFIILIFGCAQQPQEQSFSENKNSYTAEEIIEILPIKKNTACFENGKCVNLEISKTSDERRDGLMFRDTLPIDAGMLFVFEIEDIYPFWMKNTLIPLDIIWIGQKGEVVSINENTQPCIEGKECIPINPQEKAVFVLEVNAGVAEKNNIKYFHIVWIFRYIFFNFWKKIKC